MIGLLTCFIKDAMRISVNDMATIVKPAESRVVRFTVPYLTPPSVNHYKRPIKIRTSEGVKTSFAVTAEGKAFKQAVGLFARGATITPACPKARKTVQYGLYVTVVHGPKEWGDGDNYWKCVADGLQEAGVIHTDARVKVWYLRVVDNDRANPRTEIRAAILRGAESK